MAKRAGRVAVVFTVLSVLTSGLAAPAGAAVEPTGDIRVTAVDASNGRAIAEFCAFAQPAAGCSGGSGVVVLTGVPVGPSTVGVSSTEARFHFATTTVTVVAGQTVPASVRMRPAASIATVVRDAVTGRPVEEACVSVVRPPSGMITPTHGVCSDEEGRLRIGPLDGGDVTLFVNPPEFGSYGAQWVGRGGGTGDQSRALVVRTRVGRVSRIDPIRLDRAGAIAGRLTVGDGAAVNGWVGLTAFEPTAGRGFGVPADADGRYTLGGLGPYAWPLYLEADGVAPQWSGGAPTRAQARRVAVGSGATTPFDAGLVAGARVSGRTTATGFVVARNADTGDVAGAASNSGGRYAMRVLGVQRVRIDFGNGVLAGPVRIPRTGRITVNQP